MQKIIRLGVVFYLIFTSTALYAQKKEKDHVPGKNNILKINLPALVLKNISVQYERKIAKKTSVAVNVHTIPFGSLPFQSTFKSLANSTSTDVQFDQFKLGSFGVVPEIRFYVSKKGALHGFYIGPFFSYSTYKVNLPINYSSNTKTGIFDGNLNATTGGLQFGSQFSLGKHLTLDWWIFGPNYGSASGSLSFTASLSTSDQTDMSNQLAQVQTDAPFKAIKSYSVSSTGANVTAKGPWGGLRGGGFNLGFRF